MNKSAKLLLFAFAAVIFMAPSVWATTFYVASNGSDTTGNGSSTAPWQTLSYACSKVSTAGDAIYVNAGTYTDNSNCTLKIGVKVQGAGSSLVTINTSASPYINAVSSLPVVDGSNDISGISLIGSGSNTGIYSVARSNQKIHDCKFNNFGNAIEVRGKIITWISNCNTTPPSQTATYCDVGETLSIEPATTDWATGVEIYNNQLTNSKLFPSTVQGALIHDNVIDNSTSLKSAVGNTALWWNGVQFYNNTITMQTIAWSTIAIEVWMVEGDTKFYNNTTNGWFSILKNPTGPNVPYSWEIVNNTFASNVPPGVGSAAVASALETCFHVSNVLIAGNYFANTGTNNTYSAGVGLWGYGSNTNYMIRNNVFYNIYGPGIHIDATATQEATFAGKNIRIYNNVFDTLQGGSSAPVYIHTSSGTGTVDSVDMANNAVMGAAWGVVTDGGQVTSSTWRYNMGSGNAGAATGSGVTSSNNINAVPGITGTGNRPMPYYQASGSSSNLVDKGVKVYDLSTSSTLLPFSGANPDIGAYEYLLQLYAPSSPAAGP